MTMIEREDEDTLEGEGGELKPRFLNCRFIWGIEGQVGVGTLRRLAW